MKFCYALINKKGRSKEMRILDVACGSKMFWYQNHEPHTTYMDIRDIEKAILDRGKERKIKVHPDIIGDFRNIPFEDNTFDLVVFDPPHLKYGGSNSWLVIKYGKLDKDHWQEDLSRGFHECLRVLKPNGILLFKWNDDQIKFSEVIKAFGQLPIFGDKRSKTKWSVFIKTI